MQKGHALDELKGFVGILVLVVAIAAVVGGGYYLSRFEGKFCGGIGANLPQNQCPLGYTCKEELKYPDAGGKCESMLHPILKFNPSAETPDSQTPQPSPSSDIESQECGVCGPKGDHNLYGRQCAPGLECKNQSEGIATSVYFCVKPGNSIEACLQKIRELE